MEELLSEINRALEFLKDGQSFKIGNLRLDIEETDKLNIMDYSQYSYFENLTKEQSITDLGDIKTQFKQMLESSSELRNFVEGKQIGYSLYFDDGGKASIFICSEWDGIIEWNL